MGPWVATMTEAKTRSLVAFARCEAGVAGPGSGRRNGSALLPKRWRASSEGSGARPWLSCSNWPKATASQLTNSPGRLPPTPTLLLQTASRSSRDSISGAFVLLGSYSWLWSARSFETHGGVRSPCGVSPHLRVARQSLAVRAEWGSLRALTRTVDEWLCHQRGHRLTRRLAEHDRTSREASTPVGRQTVVLLTQQAPASACVSLRRTRVAASRPHEDRPWWHPWRGCRRRCTQKRGPAPSG